MPAASACVCVFEGVCVLIATPATHTLLTLNNIKQLMTGRRVHGPSCECERDGTSTIATHVTGIW